MGRLLIIDDDDGIRAALQGLLELEGHTVRSAENGKEGWQVLADGFTPDLLFLDLMMPVMDGREFFELLEREGKRSFPVVAMTAANDATASSLGMRLLRKPVSADVILALVDELIPASPLLPSSPSLHG